MFPPHAVTRLIPAGSDQGSVLSELTLLLIQMARHAGSLGPPKGVVGPPNGAARIPRGPARHTRSRG